MKIEILRPICPHRRLPNSSEIPNGLTSRAITLTTEGRMILQPFVRPVDVFEVDLDVPFRPVISMKESILQEESGFPIARGCCATFPLSQQLNPQTSRTEINGSSLRSRSRVSCWKKALIFAGCVET